jgi:hypothetical protein
MADDIIEQESMAARNSILDVGKLRGQLVSGECERMNFLQSIYQYEAKILL